jgi:heptosyltransferase-2
VEYYRRLIDAAFDRGSSRSPSDIRIEASHEERLNADRILSDAGIDPDAGFFVINAGAAFGSAKRWPEDRFARVAEALSAERGMPVVMVGARGERPIAAAIQAAITSPSANLCGETDLETLVGVLARAALVVTNDSGPMHIAAALGTPTLAIFGSTDPEVTSPRGPATRLIREPVDCSPCLLRECPIDHRCMERITPESVLAAARGFVPAGSGPG